jgi:sugar fermentation stimulation protein A
VLLFFVARPDVEAVRPADEIDPAYGRALRKAMQAGVEVLAIGARFTRRGVERGPTLEVLL